MRLMRDLSRLMRSNTENLGFSLQLKNDDALNEWSINLFGFADCALAEVGAVLACLLHAVPAESRTARGRYRGLVGCLAWSEACGPKEARVCV